MAFCSRFPFYMQSRLAEASIVIAIGHRGFPRPGLGAHSLAPAGLVGRKPSSATSFQPHRSHRRPTTVSGSVNLDRHALGRRGLSARGPASWQEITAGTTALPFLLPTLPASRLEDKPLYDSDSRDIALPFEGVGDYTLIAINQQETLQASIEDGNR